MGCSQVPWLDEEHRGHGLTGGSQTVANTSLSKQDRAMPGPDQTPTPPTTTPPAPGEARPGRARSRRRKRPEKPAEEARSSPPPDRSRPDQRGQKRRPDRPPHGGSPGRESHDRRHTRHEHRPAPIPRVDPAELLRLLDTAARSWEKPFSTADYPAQLPLIETIRQAIADLRLPNLDALESGLRGRVFTTLLRAGRQKTPDADSAKEQARKGIHLALAALWRTLGDEARAAVALEAGGRTENAATLLRQSGQWDDVARLFERQGRQDEAARLYEAHHADADAARCYRAAGDQRALLRCLLKARDTAGARALARELKPESAVEMLLRAGAGELADELLVERKEWVPLAQLREQRRDFARAAEAREEAGDLEKAAVDWRRANREDAAVAIAERLAAALLAEGERLKAAEVFARFHLPARAAPLALPERPDRAHAWYARAGLDADALAIAQKEARRAALAGRLFDAAQWHERAGDAALAAESYEKAQRWKDALRLHEQLGRWEQAAVCCEQLHLLDRARELYLRAGLTEAAAQVERRIAAAAAAPPSASPSAVE